MKDIEEAAADDNSLLQLHGANDQMVKAARAIAASLVLGGQPPGLRAEIDAAFVNARNLLRLIVALGYRHKVPYFRTATALGMEEKDVLRLLGEHFDQHAQIAHEWLTAETQRRAQNNPPQKVN